MSKAIQVLQDLTQPRRRVTDRFGAFRDWALPGQADPETDRPGWYPECGYSPIHHGVDFSTHIGPQIFCPCAANIRFDADAQMITIVPSYEGQPCADLVLFYRHVEAGRGFDDGEWHSVPSGSVIAYPDTDHTEHPHLHVEIAVTISVYLELADLCIVSRNPMSVEWMARRATIRRLSAHDVTKAVNAQLDSHGITLVEEDGIFRKNLPWYKCTKYGYLGRDNVVVVNPLAVMGS